MKLHEPPISLSHLLVFNVCLLAGVNIEINIT